jgi:hypothetical protein
MKKVLFSGIAFTALLMMGSAQAQTVGQDMHDAGHDTAHASKTVAHKTVHGTKVAARDTKHGTEVGYHKTVHVTKKGYHKTVRGTKKVAHKMDPDSSKTPQ